MSEPDCNIYMSLVLRPPVRPEEAPKLTLAAALAVQQAVARVCGAEAGIKWPNDLLLRERKFCGILTELSADVESIHFAVVGIGVNVNALEFPPEIAEVATSIRAYTGEQRRAQYPVRRHSSGAGAFDGALAGAGLRQSDGTLPAKERHSGAKRPHQRRQLRGDRGG